MKNTAVAAFLILALGLLISCSNGPIRSDSSGDTRPAGICMKVTNTEKASAVARVTIAISGDDFDTVRTYEVSGLQALAITDTFKVPIGLNRIVTIVATDAMGNVIYQGTERMDVLEGSAPMAFEVLMYEVMQRQAGVITSLVRYAANACSAEVEFFSVPASLPSRMGVNDQTIAQFFGENMYIPGRPHEIRGVVSPFLPSSDNLYRFWLFFDGDSNWVQLKMPDSSFNFKNTAAKILNANGYQDTVSFEIGSNIVLSWDAVPNASFYHIFTDDSVVFEDTSTAPESLSMAKTAGPEYVKGKVEINTWTENTSITIPINGVDGYLGHGTFRFTVYPVNGPLPSAGTEGNFNGNCRGFAIAYNHTTEDSTGDSSKNKITVKTGMGFEEANETYMEVSSKILAGNDAGSGSAQDALMRLYKTSVSENQAAAQDPVFLMNVKLVDNGSSAKFKGSIFSDPLGTHGQKVSLNSIDQETAHESYGDYYFNHIEDSEIISDSVCTLKVDMGNGITAQVIVAKPDTMGDSLKISGSLSQVEGSASNVTISWDSVANAKGYIVRCSLDVGEVVFLDTVVYDTFVVIKGGKYFQKSGYLNIRIIPFNGTSPDELLEDPNITAVRSTGKRLSAQEIQDLALAGYFWIENQVGQLAEVSVEIFKNSTGYLDIIPPFDIDRLSGSGPVSHDFEDGTSGSWISSGFWHVTGSNIPGGHSCPGTHSMWYGRDETGDFCNNAINYGWLVSPPYTVQSGDYFVFCSWSEIETQAPLSYDFRMVLYSTDNGATWKELWREMQRKHDWYSVSIPLTDPQASYGDLYNQNVRFAFMFNTRDALYNDYPGWYIDDIYISNSQSSEKIKVNSDVAETGFITVHRNELSLKNRIR